MTDAAHTKRRSLTSRLSQVPQWIWVMALSVTIYAIVARSILGMLNTTNMHFRINLTPILEAPSIVQMHVLGAVTAFMVGFVLLLSPKGFKLHKTLGWTWVVAMGITAASSFFMTGLNGAYYSPIHMLSALTAVGLPFGLMAIRKRNVAAHSKQMTGMYLGGMGVAGLFSFLPGRLMFSLFFGG